eukprot:6172079-Pleurochrysis_carterae.AAC.1
MLPRVLNSLKVHESPWSSLCSFCWCPSSQQMQSDGSCRPSAVREFRQPSAGLGVGTSSQCLAFKFLATLSALNPAHMSSSKWRCSSGLTRNGQSRHAKSLECRRAPR